MTLSSVKPNVSQANAREIGDSPESVQAALDGILDPINVKPIYLSKCQAGTNQL